jgi:hypothetical protein
MSICPKLGLLAILGSVLAIPASPSDAAGTVRIQQRDGSAKTYTNVRINVQNEQMEITSSDGKGTFVLGKAACTKVGALLRCIPYDGTLEQNGRATHIQLKSGTVWLNPSQTTQQLSHSSIQLPPRGVLLAMQTKAGTYVSMTGVVDKIQK